MAQVQRMTSSTERRTIKRQTDHLLVGKYVWFSHVCASRWRHLSQRHGRFFNITNISAVRGTPVLPSEQDNKTGQSVWKSRASPAPPPMLDALLDTICLFFKVKRKARASHSYLYVALSFWSLFFSFLFIQWCMKVSSRMLFLCTKSQDNIYWQRTSQMPPSV